MADKTRQKVADGDVIEALGISMSEPLGTETDVYDRLDAKRVLDLATDEQKAMAREQLGVKIQTKAKGGKVKKYAKGGHVKQYSNKPRKPRLK